MDGDIGRWRMWDDWYKVEKRRRWLGWTELLLALILRPLLSLLARLNSCMIGGHCRVVRMMGVRVAGCGVD